MNDMAKKMQRKFDKYWGDCNLLISIVAVLDPRNKMTLIDFTFRVIYSEEDASFEISIVRDSLYELYKEYVDDHTAANVDISMQNDLSENVATNKGSTSSGIGKGKAVITGRSKYEKYVRSVDTVQHVKSELNTYLEEGVFICKENSNDFDALEWWKANNLKFRILSKMACEILYIPIITVVSESTFSAGGRVIDAYRSSLGADTVQMLLCGCDWYRNFYGLKRKAKVSNFMLEFYVVKLICYNCFPIVLKDL